MNHSVIVPTSNRIEQLRLCLQALDSAQQPSAEWEVLVIDNSEEAARPANKEVVGSFGNSRFRYDSIPPYGLLVARHRGVELSSGQIVSFLDDDSLVSESWLQGMEEAFADEKVVLPRNRIGVLADPQHFDAPRPGHQDRLHRTPGPFLELSDGDRLRDVRAGEDLVEQPPQLLGGEGA